MHRLFVYHFDLRLCQWRYEWNNVNTVLSNQKCYEWLLNVIMPLYLPDYNVAYFISLNDGVHTPWITYLCICRISYVKLENIVNMPGSNCAIPGCGTTRRSKFSGISLFGLPPNNSEDSEKMKWREELLSIITKYRVVDEGLKKQICNNTLKICEKHFNDDEFSDYGSRKVLKDGVLATLNMPVKSIPEKPSVIRVNTAITKRVLYQEQMDIQTADNPEVTLIYNDFDEFKKRIGKLKNKEPWQITIEDELVKMLSMSSHHLLPKFEIYVDSSLDIFVRVVGWVLPDTHPLFTSLNKSFFQITLNNFIRQLETYDFCPGVSVPDSNAVVKRHVIPLNFDYFEFRKQQQKSIVHQEEYLRAKYCSLLVLDGKPCSACGLCNMKLVYETNRKTKHLNESAKLNAPVKFTSPERLKLTMQHQRLQCKQLQQQIEDMNTSLEKHSRQVSPELDKDFTTLFSGVNQKEVPPFMKLFWEEQQKYIAFIQKLHHNQAHFILCFFYIGMYSFYNQ